MRTSESNHLVKLEAAWEFVAEDIAALGAGNACLNSNERERALRLAEDLEHFAKRLRELSI